LGTEVATVRVGIQPNHVDFTVHRNLLARSPYFAEALQTTQLPYIPIGARKISAFATYQQWLYSGRLHTMPSTKEAPAADRSPHQTEWLNLKDIYVLGEFFADDEFRDRIIDTMLEWFRTTPADDRCILLETASEVYHNVRSSSPLRRLVSDVVAWHFNDTQIQEMALKHTTHQLPVDFLADTLGKLSSRFQGPGVTPFTDKPRSPVITSRGNCNYHCHGEKDCYKKE
ncbi:hypothetical protein K458DRAFT_470639, partial [Lentithecium fluviatile CBS 122367]